MISHQSNLSYPQLWLVSIAVNVSNTKRNTILVSVIRSVYKMFHKELCFIISQKCTRCISSPLVQFLFTISVVRISDFVVVVFTHYYNLVCISTEAYPGADNFWDNHFDHLSFRPLFWRQFLYILCAQLCASLCFPTLLFDCVLRFPRQITGDSHLPQTSDCFGCSSEHFLNIIS